MPGQEDKPWYEKAWDFVSNAASRVGDLFSGDFLGALGIDSPASTEDDPEDLSDEEIEDSILSQTLQVWTDNRKEREKTRSYYNNIILFNTKQPHKLKNGVINFDPQNVESIFDLTNLQLSGLVPTIEIYKVYKKKGSSEELEVLLPFPDYNHKSDIEQIFQTRTGRGGGLGIKSFEWNSLAKNQSNLAQFSAKLKIYAQDAGELTKIRNFHTLGSTTYTVSLLDLLYPSSKEGVDLKGTLEYDVKNFFLKIKVGWKIDQTNLEDENLKIDQKLLDILVSEYYITLFKHNIVFNEDGSVDLDIDFIAMAEALLDDSTRSDILFNDFIDPELEKAESEISKLIRDLDSEKVRKLDIESSGRSDLQSNPRFANLSIDQIEEQREKLKTELARIKVSEKRAKRKIYKDFVFWLNQNGLIEHYIISERDKTLFKSIHTFTPKILDAENANDLARRLANAQNSIQEVAGQLSNKQLVAADAAAALNAGEDDEDNENVGANEEDIVNKWKEGIRARYEGTGNGGGLVVPFFYLGDMLEYFFGKFVENRHRSAGVLSSNIGNKNIRLVLGSFSFSDFGNPQVAFKDGGVLFQTKSIKQGTEKTQQKVLQLYPDKKIANLAHIPISMKSFLRWFNSKILDSSLEKYTVNRFVRDIVYDLVPSNLSNKISRATPDLRISTTMNTDTIDDLGRLADNKAVLQFLQEQYSANQNNYIVDFDKTTKDSNPFYYIRSKKSNSELIKPESDVVRKLANYIFLFSNYELDDLLKRDHAKDFSNNILHFFIGEEKGMIKSIKFTREDNARLDAHNIQAANVGNQGSIIRAVYNAQIEMFGNTLFTPGMILFVNPTYPGMRINDPTLMQIGLGGYFMVLQVNSKIEGGLYTTTLDTKWQSFGTPEGLIVTKSLSEFREISDFQDVAFGSK